MKRIVLALLVVLLISGIAMAGTWNVNIPGVGQAVANFGIAQGFDGVAGSPIGVYANGDMNLPAQFTVFVVVTNFARISTTLRELITLTSPNGYVWEYPLTLSLSESNTRFWIWQEYDFSNQPAGKYVFNFYVNGENIGGMNFRNP